MAQNALGQSDFRIFKSTISLEQNDEKAWFFACWYRFMENGSWLKNIGLGVVKNGCGYSVLRTLKLPVCQGKMNEINWFWFVDTNSWKLKVTLTVFGWCDQKWAWSLRSWNSKIWSIIKTNWWNELMFSMLIQIWES